MDVGYSLMGVVEYIAKNGVKVVRRPEIVSLVRVTSGNLSQVNAAISPRVAEVGDAVCLDTADGVFVAPLSWVKRWYTRADRDEV